ncbi:MAG: hypothetical protein C0448_14480 [Sphingobacteriaceae bacterium]|nr:hypothetical protein [Sphingobacteriaceae bacterium]
MRKEKLKRVVAIYLVINIVFQIVSPSAAYALTSGPGQPEMASFEPVGTTEMVDPFSGDFNYNIPLLTVPGPNGGYPINLAYHAGIGMEDEASWVGLGWNINPGVIGRNMRGLPDDFAGENINKKINMLPNRTVGIGFGFPFTSVPEIWGFKFNQSLKLGGQWNNYKGFGFTGGYSLSGQDNMGQASLSFNSLSGEVNLNAGLSYTSKDASKTFGLTASISSLNGLKDINFSSSLNHNKVYLDGNSNGKKESFELYEYKQSQRSTGEVSFASSSFIPPSDFPTEGFNISTQFSFGMDGAGVDNRFSINASYSQTRYGSGGYKAIDFKGYGYLYQHQRTASMRFDDHQDDYKLMDYNRDREVSPSKDIPSMPAPINTYDVYRVNGQGIGGVFRPYRPDIGLLVDPEIYSENVGGDLGVEVGIGYPVMNVGVNLALNYSKQYSGPWHIPDLYDDIKSRTHKGLPAYFKLSNEIVADEVEEPGVIMAHQAFPITTMINIPDLAPTDLDELINPIVDVRVNNTGGIIDQDHYTTKKTRSQLMTYKTFGEISNIPKYKTNWLDNHTFGLNANPAQVGTNHSSVSMGVSTQIGELSVVNPDGNRYIYALPAKNLMQKEVNFSIDIHDGSDRNVVNDKIVNFLPGDNTNANNQLDDHFFTSTEIPSYVHSYMLTAIVSPDYVDLTNNGLSDDDFGYWVKFNYTKTSDATGYKWRAPFQGANYLDGYLSTNMDDKAGYTYGLKEIWYLNSIETKSHIALFTLDEQDRKDAQGAASENQTKYTGTPDNASMSQNNVMKQLNKISLFSKADLSKSIKDVHFDYNYELCKNTINSYGTDNGKLTLKKVWFTYSGNEKGSLSPYLFDYHATDPDENPNYSILQMDRWGNYKPDVFGVNSTIFPYTPQSSSYNIGTRNKHASAWCLKEITLPSGGVIKVDYEADDYAYVHGLPAMEMVKVLGFSDDPNNSITSIMKDKNQYLFFEINEPSLINTPDLVKKYFSGIKEIYFNAYINLKGNGIGGVTQTDYVKGYADINSADAGIRTTGIGYVKLEKVSIHDVPGGFPYTHPFRKAAWQYLKLQRPDILFPSSNNGTGGGMQFLNQVANSIIGSVTSATQLITGYYSYCEAAGYGKELNTTKPSFIRVNTPDGRKYGGGHRVKEISITDTWKESQSSSNPTGENVSKYGQEYIYKLADERSSGVASYEPLIGGEEIPYRKPIKYSSPYFILKNENLYIEEPIGESFYPGASVGYSRVIVKNINQTETPTQGSPNITKTREGITVHEYYTTLDAPFSINRTALEHEKFNPKIPIPFIGSVGFENHGFSQAIKVVTNNMNGLTKSIATYAANADFDNPNTLPVRKQENIYQVGGKVNALFGDGYYRETQMGVTDEQYIDMREIYGINMHQGLQSNLYIAFVAIYPVIAFIAMPTIDYSEHLNKSIVSMHVSNQSAILMGTKTFDEGSITVSKNLMFDAYSGKPLLTSVTNDYDKPVYKYEYAAHWAYDGMKNAYKTDRSVFDFTINSSQDMDLTTGTINDLLSVGDEVLIHVSGTYTRGWIKQILSSTSANLVKADGTKFNIGTTGSGLVIKSGRRNQQSVSNGAIVSLSNPVNDRKFDLFDAFNLHGNPDIVASADCSTNILKEYKITYSETDSNSIIDFEDQSGTKPCHFTLIFPLSTSINWQSVDLKKAGKKVYAISNGVILSTGDIVDECGLAECLDGVLNASAYVFKDINWDYDYVDVGDPYVDLTESSTSPVYTQLGPLQFLTSSNPYRLGTAGIWRMDKSYAYQTERKQSLTGTNLNTTKIQEDGTFKDFVLFNWDNVSTANQKWTMVNEITKYSPYGFELENKNAIGIKTSALYGYNNSAQTAIAANASYYETAFDGFEDYGSSLNYSALSSPYRKGGHIDLTPTSGSIMFDDINPHTGKKSIKGTGNQMFNMAVSVGSGTNYFTPSSNKKYTISTWFKTANGKPEIVVSGSGVQSSEIILDNIKIEGWQKVELNFTTKNVGNITIQFKVNGVSTNWYMDDIRIQPFQSTLKTFVYNPKNLWLVAELDNQNYATFYNYDEEGTLTQVKKETVKGVQTLKTTRSNIKY